MTTQNPEQIREDMMSMEATVQNPDPTLSEEQQYRASAYSLLASLLRTSPQQAVIDYAASLSDVEEQGDDLSLAMSMLGLATQKCTLESIATEYHDLFIGLGRGELVPFGSWYLTGYLMEKPLALLRNDLSALGFERDSHSHEPEDHVAALCEVMAMLINEEDSLEKQSTFYSTHMEPWLKKFFTDLSIAKTAVFYRSVGRFGEAFTDLESQYLSMKA